MTAVELINDSIIPLRPEDTISFGLRQMDENHVGQLPIIDQKKFKGVVYESDLLAAEDEDLSIESLAGFMHNFHVNQNEHYYKVLQIMSDKKVGLVPVTDDSGIYLGAICHEDIVDMASDLLAVKNPGGIIVLQISESDFSLSEISRLVESNDAKILSVGVHTIPGSSTLQLTLKINKINLEPVIQTFTRFEYEIIAYFGENEKDEELLRERYESLIQYLNI